MYYYQNNNSAGYTPPIYSNGFYSPQQQNSLKGRPVSSLEEVRAAQIDFDGSLFVFPDVANKKIYTKQINLDGTAALKAYSLIEGVSEQPPAYVTKEEFDSVISKLQETLAGKEKKNESKPNATGSNNAAISF